MKKWYNQLLKLVTNYVTINHNWYYQTVND